ncbi:polymorphic toxin-type HINT domain-containing protein [Streptomyces sp. NPDC047726]|uniref:polymorphic toxin-type HINT domain-containing protein n=1 Tax=unclassified Streptomyces TaxID=2593676 RepID=UPI0033F289A2
MRWFGRSLMAAPLSAALLLGLLPAAAIAADPDAIPTTSRAAIKQPKAVPVEPVKFGSTKRKSDAERSPWRSPDVDWPTAASADLVLDPAKAKTAPVGRLPVSLAPAKSTERGKTSAPSKLRVTVASRSKADKAGVDGLLLSVTPDETAAQKQSLKVTVDYDTFKDAYGGDWAARLRLVQLPNCSLTTPQKDQCRNAQPLKSSNDTERKILSATATATAATPTVLAAVAGAEGTSGSFKATPLQPSGAWNAGNSTGSFNWSTDIGMPAVPGDLVPKVELRYSSQSVDGRTAASNNQAGWIGDGWSMEPGYIERRYKSCNDDKDEGSATKVGDQCWYNNNAVLSLGGKTTELIYDAAKGWHPEQDSGEKVEKLTGADNGDKGTAGVDGVGEHWKITATDGTQYFFGLNKLKGWSDHGTGADDPLTNSTLTMPVFGNQTGEPCYNVSFASAWCQQAWRWQLDYVVDPHGNAMAYYWKTENNNYGRNVSTTTGTATATPYQRAGYLDRIEYGLRNESVYTAKAMARVDFGVTERCLTNCGTFNAANASNWPDVPFDLYCKEEATDCKDQYSPSFWSRKRLTSINTSLLTSGSYAPVDTWTLKQGFPASGDGISTPMWLESIQHTGKAGGSTTLPPITFAGVQMANRVDKTGDGLAPFIRLRMYQVTNESGGTVGAEYSRPDCTATTLPPSDGTNKTRCYPVKWAFEGNTAKEDWFNSYVVTKVLEGDNVAETPDTTTQYTYLDGAAWTKSTDEFMKENDRTYSVARGYGRVQTRKGGTEEGPTLAETRYFRGVDGAAVKDSAGVSVTDREQFAGRVREAITYNGDDTSKLVSAISYTPWRSAATASRPRTGQSDLQAYLSGTAKDEARTKTAAGEHKTSITRTFNKYGQVATESDTGDTARTNDEKCSTTTYAANTATNLLSLVAQKRTVATLCGVADPGADGVISDQRNYYDGSASLTAAPTKGNATKVETINGAGTGYTTTGSTPAADFDVYGRALSATDVYGKTTRTSYTPATGQVPTKRQVVNPLGHTITTELDPLRGQPLKVTDANARVTSAIYDPLGRVTKIWQPTRSAATYPDSPSQTFAYQIRNNGPVLVTTTALNHNGAYRTLYTFYDGLLREIETQDPSPDDAGRLITETSYDSRGQAWRNSGVYYATGAAEPVPVTAQELNYPSATETRFDGAGRVTAVIAKKFGDETKRTTTTYTGDTTTVVPPSGGTVRTTVADALGRITELKQYTNTDRTTSQSTKYTYNKHGRLEQVTDPSGAKWAYGYDAAGRQDYVDDPDKGETTTVYDKGGRATDVTDGRKITLHTDYDDLGRPTALTQGTTKRASWEYDKATKGLGQLYRTTRHNGNDAYTSTINNYNALYAPVGTTVTIPTAEGALAGTYAWTDVYNPHTGQLMETAQPAVGGLPEEDVVNAYAYGSSLPMSVSAGDDTLLASVKYDHYGRPAERQFGAFAKHLWKTNEYDQHTGALTRAFTDREAAPQRIDDVRYTYDPAGNIKRIQTVTGQDATALSDTQCFALDTLRRITEAWTSTDNCAAPASVSTVGGPDPYWTSYSYDAVGNRKTETQHTAAAGPATDTVRTYAAPEAGTHNLPGITQSGSDARTETYTYDGAGNTETRKIGNDATQDLKWDAEGHLASVSEVTDTTSYLYDTAGQRLMRRDSTGTTLYLPKGNELHLDKAGKVTGTRYYTAADETAAVRTGGKITFLISDHNGTSTTQVTADSSQTVTRRQSTIFGAPRGAEPTAWDGDKGFVGGTRDTDTGLTHLGAREYDPATGRFISVDPIMDIADAQQMHGYTYSNNNPVTYSDPSGLCMDPGNGRCQPDDGGQNHGKPDPDFPINLNPDDGIDNSHLPTTNLGSGESQLPPKKAIHLYVGKKRDLTNLLGMVTKWQYYQPEMSIELNTELFLREQCSFSFVQGCDEFRKFYDGWKHVDKIPTPDTCPICGNVGFQAIMAKILNRGGCGKCFLAGTEVLMADGTTKKIKEVKPGDEVQAADPETGKTGARRVTALIVTEDDKHFNELSITSKTGASKLTATHEHPFWSPSENRWITADGLKPGMTLLTESGGTATVTGNRSYDQQARTYNLTVDDMHTYYVLAGATPVLVHNSCGVFDNKMSKTLDRELSLADRLGVTPSGAGSAGFDSAVGSGTIKWAVREDGSLVVVPKFVDGQEISHSVLSRGAPVRAAGEADIAGSSGDGFFGLDINNHSGHFRPSNESLQIGRDAFAAAGVHF